MKNVHIIEKEVKGQEWTKALDEAFKKEVKKVNVDGFRKGAIPKDMFIKKFGIESLFGEAVDIVLNDIYGKTLIESKLTPVVEPKVDIKSVDKDSLKLEFSIITRPEVTIGEYKNLGVKKEEVKVSKKEIEEEVAKLAAKYAEIVVKENGEVVEGNTAVIDFKGIVDGKELEGGSGENYPLEIGSKTFIPGFEEGIVGMKVGEEKVLNLKFPENYTEELKNKDVVFTVKVNTIKERVLPELNEDFYKDLGFNDVKTEEEFNNEVKKSIEARKSADIDNKYIDECLDKAMDKMKVEINPEILDDEVHRMMHQVEDQLKMQGITMEQYMQFSNIDHEAMHKQMEPEATKRIKARYLLEEIADKENITIADKDADAEASRMAENYGMTKEELITEFGGLDIVKYDMKMKKAIELLKESK